MGVLDKLRSRGDEIAAQRLGRDQAIRDRVSKRPDWIPDNWPEGVPVVSLSAAYAGQAEAEAKRTDGVTVRTLDTADQDVRLSDAQLDGWRAVAQLEQRRTVANELRDVIRRTET